MPTDFAVRRMASRLRTLHALRQQALALHQPRFRIRALLTLVQAALALDRALARWTELRPALRWGQHYIALLTADVGRVSALAPVPSESTPLSSWHSLLSLLNDASTRREVLAEVERSRLDGLARALCLHQRSALLARVAVAVATRPEELPACLSELPVTERVAALQLARTGIYSVGGAKAYLGDTAEMPHFTASRLQSAAFARTGNVDGFEQSLRDLPRAQRRQLLPFRAVAQHAAGDARAAEGLLASPETLENDRALVAIVELELRASRNLRAEELARGIASPARRTSALGSVLRHELRRGIVRRSLWRELSPATCGLERALLCAEHEIACADVPTIYFETAEIARYLEQEREPEAASAHPAFQEGPWDRALRVALALASHSERSAQRAQQIVLRAWPFLQRPTLEAELSAELPGSWTRLEALLERLPAKLAFVADWLRCLFIERAARREDDALLFAEPDTLATRALLAPACVDSAFVSGALLGVDSAVEISTRATSPLRAAFDLGTAQAPGGQVRRGVLLRAVRATLKSAEPASTQAIDLRLATLRALGVTPVTELLGVVRSPSAPREARCQALLLLARHDRKLALRALFENFGAITGGAALEVYAQLERAQLFESGTARAFERLQAQLALTFGAGNASEFWPRFAQAWLRFRGAPPTRRVLKLLELTLRSYPAYADGEAAFRTLLDHVERWRQHGVVHLFRDPSRALELAWLTALCEPYPTSPWDVGAWKDAVRWGQSRAQGEVEVQLVAAFVKRLRLGGTARARLLAGTPPLPELERPLPVDRDHELRFLDKRRDFLAFLRLADCVPCCFASTGGHYTDGMQNLRWVYRLWQDPLSFALHLHTRGQTAPVGFVFGGFGVAEAPVLLLNGVYLRRQREALRLAIIAALEQQLARPLGLREVGIASQYGGRGVMPSGYRFAVRRVKRLRALRHEGGGLELHTYDDIGKLVNVDTDMRLYFRTLSDARGGDRAR